ncbi:calcineurin-binding protein cabin-1 isoform X2 [Parasteatoda tepidariorum]
MKFCALNEASLSEDDGDPELATREAQEEEAYLLYHQALKKQSDGDIEDAEKLFKEILEMDFLTQVQPNEEKEELPLRPALTLKYLLYKNLATISNDKKDFKSAVEYFLEALEIDGTDVIMWFRMGNAAINISNFPLARLCFEEGLKSNPNHWPSMDKVITVMYALNDYAGCLFYIAKALERECYYLKGLAFKDEIYKEDPSLKSFCGSYFNNCDSSIHYIEYDKEEGQKLIQEALDMREKKRSFNKPTILPTLSLGQPIKELTWKALGDSLVNMYDVVYNATPTISFNCKIDLSQYGENANKNEDKLQCPSPISSLSEACSSSSTFRCNGLPPGQKSDGLLQLANNASQSAANENNAVEMEVDDVPSAGNSNQLQNSSYLVLPQIETTPTDLSMYNDSASGSRRTSKRKRLLTELSEFSSKRRSTRVRNPALRKPHDNVNYQELLQKFLPSKLIGDGKFEEQDEDSETASNDKGSDLNYGQSSEHEKNDKASSFNELVSTEKDDVNDFLKNNQSNGGIIDLLYNYVTILGSKSSLVWPKTVIDVYCSAFQRLRKHITVPNIFSQSTELRRLKEMGYAILVFCEFKVDKWYLSTGHTMSFSPKGTSSTSNLQHGSENVGNDFHSDMEFLVHLTVRRDALIEEWLTYSIRALWLKTKFHSLEGEVDLAVCCMGKLCDVFSDEENVPAKIIVQNISVNNIITASNVQQQLESLQRCQSLEEVQRLYEHKDYTAVVDLLVLSFNQPRTKRKQNLDGVPERHAQLLLLQNSLWNLERYKECVYWSEVSFNEALQQFMNAARCDWSETMAQLLQKLDNCAKINSDYLGDLDESKLVRLTQNLILVIVIQMENYDFSADNASSLVVLPWIILYRLILNEEKRKVKKPGSKEKVSESGNSKACVGSFLTDFDLSSKMPSSLMLLFTAHEYLGRRSWCTAADGLLLLHCIDVMMADLQDFKGNSYLYREDLETGLEQCIYCLYGHPHKRTRAKHLQEHNSKQISLTWERAATIFQYFKPNILPEFDSYRTSTISAELESLLKRITSLVPPDEDPTTCFDTYTAYIEGATDRCPDPPFGNKTMSPLVKDLYYLLGDYYFKNKEFSKAIRLYLMDICINPDRQDSWAGMALSRSSQLDQKLNSYELRNESTIYRKSSAALRCFEHALELDPTTTSLWIEHGSLAYILHSHASRQLKQDNVCDELGELLRKKKTEMLQCAKKCFKAANCVEDGGEPEEAWLHHYMLGKIAEKEGLGPPVYLDHYQKALMYLHEDFARYPQKILYHNPAELSIEVLEVYYRLHASCLKFLWKHEVIGTDLETLKTIKRCLIAVKESPFAKYQEKCKKEISYSTPSSESEEYIVTAVTSEPKSNADHTYFGDANKVPKKISESSDRRQSRPSTDSSPEAHESASIKEVMDSLVGVVSERFVDEEIEQAENKNSSSGETQNLLLKFKSITVVESFAEECVYTSNQPPETMITPEDDAEKKLKRKMAEEQERINQENEELAKMQALAMELETEAAASKLVEEMNLQNEEMDHYDYSDYGMYDQKQEDHDSAYYESVVYEEDTKMQENDDERAVRSSLEENERAVQSLLEENNKMDEETEMAVQSLQSEDERAVQSLLSEDERAVQSLMEENEKAIHSMLNESNNAVQEILPENEIGQSVITEDEKAVMSIIGKKEDNNLLFVNETEKESELAFEDDKMDVNLTIDFEETLPSTVEDKDELLSSEKENINKNKSDEDKDLENKTLIQNPPTEIGQLSDTQNEEPHQFFSNDGNKDSLHPTLHDKMSSPSDENKEAISLLETEKDVEIVSVLEFLLKTVDDSEADDKASLKPEIMDVEPLVESTGKISKTSETEVYNDELLVKESCQSNESTNDIVEHELKDGISSKEDDPSLNNPEPMESSPMKIESNLISDPKEKSVTSETDVNAAKQNSNHSKEIDASKENVKLEAEVTVENLNLDKLSEDNIPETACDKDKTKGPKKTESSSISTGSGKSKSKKKPIIMTLPKIPPSPEELLQSQSEIAKLIPACLDSLREVLQRFIQHYKALYRMAHYFCHSKRNKNLQWAREILLAATPPSKKYPSMPGLFADRKNTNLFNGIWRAPSNEIDRPGSFGAHMYRSVHLLIEVLNQQKDYNMLVYLSQQLYRTPDLGKKYMRDTDRVVLVREAYDCCVNILRDQMNSLLQEEPPPEESRLICCLLEIYRSCQTLLKAGIYVDETNELLVEAYTMYRIGEVDPYPSVLDQATKFCQLQLGKSYSQDNYGTTRSKYAVGPDMGEVNTSLMYSTDPWQKGKRA